MHYLNTSKIKPSSTISLQLTTNISCYATQRGALDHCSPSGPTMCTHNSCLVPTLMPSLIPDTVPHILNTTTTLTTITMLTTTTIGFTGRVLTEQVWELLWVRFDFVCSPWHAISLLITWLMLCCCLISLCFVCRYNNVV